jgi:hypothetical protein
MSYETNSEKRNSQDQERIPEAIAATVIPILTELRGSNGKLNAENLGNIVETIRDMDAPKMPKFCGTCPGKKQCQQQRCQSLVYTVDKAMRSGTSTGEIVATVEMREKIITRKMDNCADRTKQIKEQGLRALEPVTLW